MKVYFLAFALLAMISANAQTGNPELFICKILLAEQYKKSGLGSEEGNVINQHAQYLDDLGKQGKLIFAGRTKVELSDPRLFGLILIHASSAAEIEKMRDSDPAFKASIQLWEPAIPFSLGKRFLENLSSDNENLIICKVVLTEKYKKSGLADAELKIINEHSSYLDRLGREGKLIFAGRTKLDPREPRDFGIILFKASSIADVEKYRDNNPACKASVLSWEIIPYSMGIRHFENLK